MATTIIVVAVSSMFHAQSSSAGVAISRESPKQITMKNSAAGESVQPAVDFEKAASVAVPSVVHIKTVIKAKQAAGDRRQQNPFGNDFNDDFLRRFFGGDGRSFSLPEQQASGSGVIVTNDGYIVTNNHVVDGASEITVTLNSRKNYRAGVIGTDVNTDLAVIKIDAKDLPVMPIGNSDNTHLGQWVLAIGYPLNLDVTVTQGIISAKSRNIGINHNGPSPVEAFIQTDAAVNPGSSGGALVNINGELIGINAAIASPTGSYAGYAYSIPSNLMQKVGNDIMKDGSVQRGYLGISLAPEELNDATKKALGINEDIKAVWVMDVDPRGAAGEAGIRKGDAITKFNGVAIATSPELAEQIARQKPGNKVSIDYLRGKEEKTVTVVLKNKPGVLAGQQEAIIEMLGVKLSTLAKDAAVQMGIAGGVQVTEIGNGVVSDQTAMRPGFVITKLGGMVVKSVEELKEILSRQDKNFQVEGVYPGNKTIYYYGINDYNR